MSRPERIPLVNGQQAWDSVVNDDFKLVFNRPLAICQEQTDESTTLTESNLAASYAAASFSECFVWVNHSVRGFTLYRSNGTTWEIVRGATRLYARSISALATVQDYDDIIICGGTTYTLTLPTAVGQSGRVLYIKRNSSGTITVDGAGSETIDGDLTQTLTITLESMILVSDGANWFQVGGSSGSGVMVEESISGTDTISEMTDIAICSGTTYTVTLPAAGSYGAGRILIVKRTSSGTITVDADGSETIDGAADFSLNIALMSVSLYSDGSNWHVV